MTLKNIDYVQADILDLELLEKEFDIVESIGFFTTWKIHYSDGKF